MTDFGWPCREEPTSREEPTGDGAPRRRTTLTGRTLAYLAQTSYALYVVHPLTDSGWMGHGDVMLRYAKRMGSFIVPSQWGQGIYAMAMAMSKFKVRRAFGIRGLQRTRRELRRHLRIPPVVTGS